MSVASRHLGVGGLESGFAGLRMTADKYLALGETRDRYQLIDGVVVTSPSPSPLHQEIKIAVAFQVRGTSLPDGVPRVFLDIDVLFDDSLVYCPDVSVYRRSRLTRTPSRLTIAPDLIVEVLSPSNRGLDLVTKRRDFDRFGVGEYWIIDPDTNAVRVLRRRDGAFVEAPESESSADQIVCAAIPGLTLDMRAIRAIPGE